MTPAAHPAVFSHKVIEEFSDLVGRYDLTNKLVLDPFAGVGQRIDALPVRSVKVELQWAWAVQAETGMVQANARQLPFRDDTFDGAITSPAYGNRMADKHVAKERCARCNESGVDPEFPDKPCAKCHGSGRNTYKRVTYAHSLRAVGEEIHPDNTGGAQWTQPAYKELHVAAWTELTRVCKTGAILLLNVSDHVRDKKVANVSQWHMMTLTRLGWRMREFARVDTPRMRFGANHQARLYYENIFVMEKK